MESYLNGRLVIFRQFYDAETSNWWFERLREDIKWLDKSYENADGTVIHLPRLTANYGTKSYNYSSLTFTPEAWTRDLLMLKETAENLACETFNALVLQLYRDGDDRVNWHSDDDACVGQNPTIVSISFGETRSFWFKSKDKMLRQDILKLMIHAGDIVLMQGTLQHSHLHTVPKEENKKARINLTFRKVVID